MFPGNESGPVAGFLTAQESHELNRIRSDGSVVGYALIGLDGSEIETTGAFRDMSAAIFANVFDLADRLGDEIGEAETCPMVFVEGPDFEIAGITMSAAKAVIIKRKQPRRQEGLRSVS